jgi:hypothetical protein
MTLREADASLDAVRMAPEQVPFLVRLVENPKLDLPLLDVFHGATDLPTHDYIHLVLGRGLLAKDEAFVIGFTMGATDQVGRGEEFLYGVFAKYLYPRQYRFTDEDLRVFSGCGAPGLRLRLRPEAFAPRTSSASSTRRWPQSEMRSASRPTCCAPTTRSRSGAIPASRESARLLD